MLQPYQDSYYTQFTALDPMMDYHAKQANSSRWERRVVNTLRVAPLDKKSRLYSDRADIAADVSGDAIEDTAAICRRVMWCLCSPSKKRTPKPLSSPRD